jgi:hypothetical protein
MRLDVRVTKCREGGVLGVVDRYNLCMAGDSLKDLELNIRDMMFQFATSLEDDEPAKEHYKVSSQDLDEMKRVTTLQFILD